MVTAEREPCPWCEDYADGFEEERCPKHAPPPDPCEVCRHVHDATCDECNDWGGPCA